MRSLNNLNEAQPSSWEPIKETVDSVRKIWKDLHRARLYVTSPIDLKESSAHQVPDQRRLWSWVKEDKELFDRRISSLLTKKFGF